MSAERHGRIGDAIAGGLAAELRIDEVSGVASRPPGIGAVDHLVDRLRRQVVAQPVATHVGGPSTAGRGIDPHAHRVS